MSISNSRRKQRGVTLIELSLVMAAAMAAAALVATLYTQSSSDANLQNARTKIQLLMVEVDRSYPSGVYNGASTANFAASLAVDHALRTTTGLGISASEPIRLVPAPPVSGLSQALIASVDVGTTQTCEGVMSALTGSEAQARIGGNLIVDAGQSTGILAVATACNAPPLTVEIRLSPK